MLRVRFSIRLLTVMFLLGLVAGCGSDGENRPDERTTSQVDTVRVGYIPVTHCLPLYVAIDQGMMSDENLEVDLVSLPGGARILEALASGSVQIGFSNVVSLVLARSEGFPFKAFSGGPVEDTAQKDHAILVRSESSITGVPDLRGKTIAVNTRHNIDHLMVLELLSQNRISASSVTLTEVPFPRMLGVLRNGSVDAVAAAEPFITLGTSQGDMEVLVWNYVAVRPRTFVATYVTSEVFLQTKGHVVERFARALAKATGYMEEKRAHSRQLLTKFTSLSDSIAQRVNLPRFVPYPDTVNVRQTIELMRSHGMLQTDVQLSELVASVQ